MDLVGSVRELSEKYKVHIKRDVEREGLGIDSKYHLSTLCINIIGLGEELQEYISGKLLYNQAHMIYREIVSEKEPSLVFLRNFEINLNQTRLAIETGNKIKRR